MNLLEKVYIKNYLLEKSIYKELFFEERSSKENTIKLELFSINFISKIKKQIWKHIKKYIIYY